MRVPLIAGNWKMNGLPEEAEALLTAIRGAEEGPAELLVCPPFTALPAAQQILSGSFVHWGAQNVYPAEKGAYTGEISPAMLAALGCRYGICGHSERRQLLGESDAFVNRKVKALLTAGITPILCVGESGTEREEGRTESVIQRELAEGLRDVPPESPLVIAYEPVWAIGAGQAATAEEAGAVCRFIRKVLAGLFGREAAGAVRILYGGSVTSANIASFLKDPDVDGALVGGASLKAGEFISIYKQAMP